MNWLIIIRKRQPQTVDHHRHNITIYRNIKGTLYRLLHSDVHMLIFNDP